MRGRDLDMRDPHVPIRVLQDQDHGDHSGDDRADRRRDDQPHDGISVPGFALFLRVHVGSGSYSAHSGFGKESRAAGDRDPWRIIRGGDDLETAPAMLLARGTRTRATMVLTSSAPTRVVGESLSTTAFGRLRVDRRKWWPR